MSESAERICAKCRYADFWNGEFYPGGEWCVHPKVEAQIQERMNANKVYSPVIGYYVPRDMLQFPECADAREEHGACGPTGELWEAKHKSWIHKMLAKESK